MLLLPKQPPTPAAIMCCLWPRCRHPQVCAYVLAVTMVLHVLAVLFTYWSVSFNALVNYKAVTALSDAEYVQVSGSCGSGATAMYAASGSCCSWAAALALECCGGTSSSVPS